MSPVTVASKLCSVERQFSDVFINRRYTEGVPEDKTIWERVSIFKQIQTRLSQDFSELLFTSENYDSLKRVLKINL